MDKLRNIIGKLQEAKAEGLLITDLFNDWEKSVAIRVTKHRLKKIYGIKIKSKNGKWYLDKEYWDTSPVEFRDMVIIYEIGNIKKVVLYSMTMAVIMALGLGLIIGSIIQFEYA